MHTWARGCCWVARRSHGELILKERRSFGYVRKLPSKRWQASYIGRDLTRHSAPYTFHTKMDAEAWLLAESKLIASDDWVPPKRRREMREALLPPTFGDYAAGW